MIKTTVTGLVTETLAHLSARHEPPCLSLYQATHRRYPDNRQDPIRFRNLLKVLETSICEKYPNAATQLLMAPFEALAKDEEFWNHALDGLAVFGGPGSFQALRIPESVSEMVVVADSFHTTPLRRFLQSDDRYQVLGLGLEKVRFFEGNRHALEELELVEGVPRTIADALGSELTEPHQTVASYGGVGGEGRRMHHGAGSKADELDTDTERFFRAVDRAVLEHYSKPSGLPLLLAALPEHHHLFHQVSRNPLLVAEGIEHNPDSVPPDELRLLAWKAIEPRYQSRLLSVCDEFERARSQSVGSDDVAQVAAACASGRVKTLLIDAERKSSDRVETAGSDPLQDDVVLDLGELVANNGGTVVVIPTNMMPSRTGLAAIYRY